MGDVIPPSNTVQQVTSISLHSAGIRTKLASLRSRKRQYPVANVTTKPFPSSNSATQLFPRQGSQTTFPSLQDVMACQDRTGEFSSVVHSLQSFHVRVSLIAVAWGSVVIKAQGVGWNDGHTPLFLTLIWSHVFLSSLLPLSRDCHGHLKSCPLQSTYISWGIGGGGRRG